MWVERKKMYKLKNLKKKECQTQPKKSKQCPRKQIKARNMLIDQNNSKEKVK